LSGTAGGGGWYTSEVVVSLTAADGGSGVASTQVRVDGGAWQTYSAPVPVQGEGSHTVEYLSSDVAGNTEAVRTTTFRIDTLDPLVAIDSPRNGDVLGTSTAEVRWTASDSGSGL